MSYLWVAVGQAQGRGRLRELADDSDKNWIATPKGRKRKKPDGTWQYDYTKPGTGKKAAVASKPTPKAGSKTMKKEAGTGEVEKLEAPQKKEPWGMGFSDLVDYMDRDPEFKKKFEYRYGAPTYMSHYEFVTDAIKAGKDVPIGLRREMGLLKDWEMSPGEYHHSEVNKRGARTSKYIKREDTNALHKDAVEAALQGGKTVPPEVLADYPDLAQKYGQKAAPKKAAGKPAKKEQQETPADDATMKMQAHELADAAVLDRYGENSSPRAMAMYRRQYMGHLNKLRSAGQKAGSKTVKKAKTNSVAKEAAAPAPQKAGSDAASGKADQLIKQVNDLYAVVHEPTVGFEAIDEIAEAVGRLPATEAVRVAKAFDLRLPNGASRAEAVRQIKRKLTEQKGSANRISVIDSDMGPRAKTVKKEAAGSDAAGLAKEVEQAYNTAASAETTNEKIDALAPRLEKLGKAELMPIAEKMGLRGSHRFPAKKLREMIVERIHARKGATQRVAINRRPIGGTGASEV